MPQNTSQPSTTQLTSRLAPGGDVDEVLDRLATAGQGEAAGVDDGLLALVEDERLLTCSATEVTAVVETHRALLDGERQPPQALVVPLARLEAALAVLTTADHDLPLVLVADPEGAGPLGLDDLRERCADLLDDDRVEVIGTRVPLPPVTHPLPTVQMLIAALNLAVPTAIGLPEGADADELVAAIAADGAEHLAVDVTDPRATDLIALAATNGVRVHLTGVRTPGHLDLALHLAEVRDRGGRRVLTGVGVG